MSSEIVVIGPICAGKGTTTEILKNVGYFPFSGSEIVRRNIGLVQALSGRNITGETLFSIVDTAREEFGTDIYARLLVDQVNAMREKKKLKKVVFEGARHPDELLYCRQEFANTFILGIDAPYETRKVRYMDRQRQGDVLTDEGFAKADTRDRGLAENTPFYGTRTDDCMRMSDEVVHNTGSIEELKDKILSLPQIDRRRRR